MRYIDSGSRDAKETLGAWLQQALTPDVSELRWQTGFFNADPLGIFMDTLQRLAQDKRPINVVIGSNDPGVLCNDVAQLVHLLGLPKSSVNLGIVQYANGFYHPKTYHLRREDGSQCAYVGSANLTGQGVASLHVEAGLLLESRDGDPDEVLDRIATSVDDWFTTKRDGLYRIVTPDDIDRLVNERVLALTAPPRPSTPPTPPDTGAGDGGDSGPRPRLRPLMTLPSVPSSPMTLAGTATSSTALFKDSDSGRSTTRAGEAARETDDPRTGGENTTTGSGLKEVLLMRVRPRRNGTQLQISMRVHQASFMNNAEQVVSGASGSPKPIGYDYVKRAGKKPYPNIARFEAPELAGMAKPVARFQWVHAGNSGRDVAKVLQYEIFDANSGGEGDRIFRKLTEGIATPPETNLRKLSRERTVLSKSDRETAQWYRLDSV